MAELVYFLRRKPSAFSNFLDETPQRDTVVFEGGSRMGVGSNGLLPDRADRQGSSFRSQYESKTAQTSIHPEVTASNTAHTRYCGTSPEEIRRDHSDKSRRTARSESATSLSGVNRGIFRGAFGL